MSVRRATQILGPAYGKCRIAEVTRGFREDVDEVDEQREDFD